MNKNELGNVVLPLLSREIINAFNSGLVPLSSIGLGNVDNTADLQKPVSLQQQAALDTKVDKSVRINAYSLSSDVQLTKGDIGLTNVDNTADASKPVSAQQLSALNLKVDKSVTINSHPLSTNIILTKNDIGLSNVDNTADADKPVSAGCAQSEG